MLPVEWSVPQRFRDRMGEKAGRQRAMMHEGHLLLILHRLPRPGQRRREGVLFWRKPDGSWVSTAGPDGLGSLRRHVEEHATGLDSLEQRFDLAGGADDHFAVLRELLPLHRTAVHMHDALQEAREAVPEDRAIITLRDRAGEIVRASDLLHGDVRTAVEHDMALQAEEQSRNGLQVARAGYRLNVLAAVFLPLTAVGSIFGMNLKHGLENASPGVFWTVLVIGSLLGFALHAGLSLAPPSSGKPARPGARAERHLHVVGERSRDRGPSRSA